MPADRYMKLILTIIAIELLWLGVREAAPPAIAQQRSEPTAVVITGVRIGNQDYTTLPVAIVGGLRSQDVPSSRELPRLEPLSVRVSEPVAIDPRQPMAVTIANQPVTVQTGSRPLVVDAVVKTGPAPGR